VPFHDVLSGLSALFLEKPANRSQWGGLLHKKAPGLSPSERHALLSIPEDRLDVYVGLLRDNQVTMVKFVAPTTLEAIVKFAGVPEEEVARSMLVETPRKTSRLRELAARVVDHLRGPGAAWVTACPPLLDLARLEKTQTECFYAPDDEGALTPHEFAERVGAATFDDVMALEARPSASWRTVSTAYDVLDWRARRFDDGAFPPPPERLERPVEVGCAREPHSLQAGWHRFEPAILRLLEDRSKAGWEPLEALAAGWVEATGSDPDDPASAGRFLDQVGWWVRDGVVVVRLPAGAAGS
jgi:hypothetical protein